MPERYLGRTLGKYRVDEVIGSGGFAWVYRGYDPELEIPVAIKVLKPQFAGDPAFEERFRREASTSAKLRHPNIVKIYSVGKDGDAVYFVMDYLPTGLADKLEKTVSLPEEFVIRVGIDVAGALGFAHREGVIHRDIKVDNIMFDVHGNAVVADFGIARALTGHTQQTGTNMVVGTPQYFAPEQARAKPLDGRADIYSLGVTLYRSITGRLPFEGDDWYEIARQHVEEKPPAPSSFNSTISPEFEHVLLRCLAKHPDDRPVTGEELSDELSSILDARRSGSSVRSRTMTISPSSAPTVISPMVGRSHARLPRRVLLVSVLVVAALGAAAVPLLARWRSARDGPVPEVPSPVESLTTRFVGPVNSTPAKDTSPVTPSGIGVEPVVPVRRDTTTKPAVNTARLVLAAPGDARLSVNGIVVGDGRWRADTMKPAEYVVVAIVDAMDGCESAKAERIVRLRAGMQLEVVLSPRACGTVTIDGQPPGAHFVISSGDGTVKREGTLPLEQALVLPASGGYRFIAQKPQCAQFEMDFTLLPAQAVRIPFRMICASP